MKIQLLLLGMMVLAKAQEPYLTETLEVPMEEQEKYVRELAKYFFKKTSWQQVFDESKCPEFKEPVYEKKCISPDNAPIPPLPPINICQYNPQYEGCPENPEENPECTADNMRLCQPPTACDLDEFKNTAECTNDEPVDCEANPHHKKCRYASKCDLGDTFTSLEECKSDDPCRQNAALCLTACDHNQNVETLRCKIERCHLVPTGEKCYECNVCKIERTCKDHNIFTDPRCCPDIYCNEECIEGDEDCTTLPPEEKCEWGHKLGDKLSEMFYEPVQKHSIDQNGLTSFYNCLDEHVKETQTIELKCFEDGMKEGFQKLTKKMEEQIAEFKKNYKNDEVTTLIDEKDHKKLEAMRASSDKIMAGL